MILLQDIVFPRIPRILIFDSDLAFLDNIGAFFSKDKFAIVLVNSVDEALKSIEDIPPDLILIRLSLPDKTGFFLCNKLREISKCPDTPVVFLSAHLSNDVILEGFEIGAVDYLFEPFEKEMILARIKIHLALKFSNELLRQSSLDMSKINEALNRTNLEKDSFLEIMNKELERAAEYVTSLLPRPMNFKELKTDWKFVPSEKLGGDSFGYHWLDDNRLAIYLLDVCYHGIGSALLSVTLLNHIKMQNLRKTDFKQPSEVLKSLNSAFQMINHNDMFFSIWYGVYDKRTRELSYATAGHPPALLLSLNGNEKYLSSKNIFIGVENDYYFKQQIIKIDESSSLFIFSDGVYEIKKADGKLWTLNEFYELIRKSFLIHGLNGRGFEMDEVYEHALNLRNGRKLHDDFSILKVTFH